MSAILRAAALHCRTYLSRRPVLGSAVTAHRTTLPTLQPSASRTWTAHAFSTRSPRTNVPEKEPPRRRLPKDPYLLSKAVMKLSKRSKLDEAIALVVETPMNRQSEVVWNHLIQESSKLGKGSQSWRLLSDMKKRGFKPSERTYTILLNDLAINSSSPSSIDRAKALYQQMQDNEDTPPTVTHTNALLKACARKPDFQVLQEIYESMPKSGPRAPNVVTFNIVINSFARMGGDQGFEKAWKVWEDCMDAKMRRPNEVELDPSLVDGVLLACREAESVSFAKRGRRIVESLYGLSLPLSGPAATSGSTEAGIMSITERAISPGKGLGLGPILQNETIRPRTVELLLSIRTKFKDYDKAEQLMDLVRTTYPDFKPDAQLLASVMHLHIVRKEYGKAIQAWDEINALQLQHTPSTFKQGLDASLKDRNWEKTLEIYTEMKKLIAKNQGINTSYHRPVNPIVRQQDAWTLVSTVKCAVKTKHIADAVQILQESKWAKVVQNPQYPRANTDLAEQAIKVYSLASQKARSSKEHKTLGTQENRAKVESLEKELQKAKELHAVLRDNLVRHDAKQLRQKKEVEKDWEEEENNIHQNPRRHSSTLTRRSSLKMDNYKTGSEWREVAVGEVRSDNPEQRHRGFSKRDSSRRSGLPEGPRGRESNSGQLAAAFQLSKVFTRDVF